MIGIDTTFLVQIEIRDLPKHASAFSLFRRQVVEAGESLALAPQVVSEFIHVVTDGRRFERPLTMGRALGKARLWWTAREVHQVCPTPESVSLFLDWMTRFRLGRKRVLDTQLAATLRSAGVRRLLTSNPDDFRIFSEFELLTP